MLLLRVIHSHAICPTEKYGFLCTTGDCYATLHSSDGWLETAGTDWIPVIHGKITEQSGRMTGAGPNPDVQKIPINFRDVLETVVPGPDSGRRLSTQLRHSLNS